jgi:hypothetical protein
MKVYQVGYSGVGAFQLAASIGITGGFLINWFAPQLFSEPTTRFPRRALGTSLIAVLALLACAFSATVSYGLFSFFVLNFTYECVWLHHNSEFFRASPKHHAARYQFTLSSCAAFLMSLLTLSYSAAVEFLGASTGICLVLGTSLIVFAIGSLLAARRRSSQLADGTA